MLAFTAILRIDLCILLLLLVCQGFFLLEVQSFEFALGCGAFALSCIAAFIGWIAVTNERTAETVVFVTLSLFLPAYVGYSLWNVWEHPGQLPPTVQFSLFGSFGGMFFVTRLLTLVQTWRCAADFGKGIFSMLWMDFDRSRRNQLAAAAHAPFLSKRALARSMVGGSGGGEGGGRWQGH